MDQPCCSDVPTPTYRPRLCISQMQVRQALDTLLYTSQDSPSSALTQLFMIDVFLANHDFPCSPSNRIYALHTILIELITDSLTFHRQVIGLGPIDRYASSAEAMVSIQADAKWDNPELIGWSGLYYRYVRSDLGISPAMFSQTANIEPRTLRRYQRHAIARLTVKLIEREGETKRHHRKQRLSGFLPLVAPTRLFGRDRELASVQHLLQSEPPIHIQVNGPEGIGKSVFVQEAVRQQITAGRVDYLFWIEHPSSVQAIREHLQDVFRFKAPGYTLRDCAAHYELVVVLDDLESVQQDMNAFDGLLRDLSTEVVYLVNRRYIPVKDMPIHLQLKAVDFASAERFTRYLMTRDSHSQEWGHPDEVVREVWRETKGNPGAMKQTIQRLYLSPS